KDTYFKASKPIVSLDFETPIADALDAEKMPVTIYGVPGYDAGKDGKGLLLSDKTQTAVFVNDAEHTLFAPEKMILNFDVKFNGNEKSDYQESIVSFIYGQAGVKNVGTTRNWCFVLRYIEDAEGKAYLSMNNSLDAGNVLEVEDGKWYGCTVVAYEGKYMLFIDGIYMGEKTRPDYTDEAYGGGTTFRIGDSRQTNFTIDSITVHSLITENTTGESVAIYEGECGENTTWSFDPDTYTLTIDGTGAMNDYELALDAPWYIYAKDIKTVVISEGVTYIGANAFKNYVTLLSVKLSSTVTDIGKDAFMNTWKMVEIINLSELELTLGSTDYGRIAQRCNVIHSGDSKIVYEGGLGFYRINLTWSSLVDYIGNDSVLVLPENHEGHQYNIGVRAFEGNEYLEEVTLGNTPYIGAKAFLDCKNLKKVTVGATTTNVDATAFDGCENVEFVLDKDNAYLTACLHKGILVNVNRVVNANGDVQLLCSSCGTLKDSYKLGEDKLLELDFETAVEETLDAEKMPVTITGSVEYADRDGAKALQLNKGMVYINDTEKALFASA
ncbi:MAG: leucine-rich repeat domain-containing protein, partial [Clostridia bacterium]|nr:leucine-rich repeat domain-containing protein [Clostridia bacterium]